MSFTETLEDREFPADAARPAAQRRGPVAIVNASRSTIGSSSGVVPVLLCLVLVFGCAEGSATSQGVEVDRLEVMTAPSSRIDRMFAHFPASARGLSRRDTTGAAKWVEETLSSMTLRRKIGQLIVARLALDRTDAQPRSSDTRAVTEHGVGGFLISRILPPERVAEEAARLQSLSDVPLFIAADYERGVGRFANNFTELPSAMAIGASRDTVAAEAAGRLTAVECRAIGVNLIFAPVVDVNNNPDNPIINIRSYGSDPELVASNANAFVRGAASAGVMTTLKHFPGHGNSEIDTHTSIATIDGSIESITATELRPYELAVETQDVPAVMVAHLRVPALDSAPVPASMSPKVMRFLRAMVGDRTVLFTDDVRMGALQNDFPLARRAVGPLLAGADVILTPEQIAPAIDAIERAVRDGRVSVGRIDQSVRRVLAAKAALGMHRGAGPDFELMNDLAVLPYGQAIADSIALESLTWYRGSNQRADRGGRQLLIQLSNFAESESIDEAMRVLANELAIPGSDELRVVGAPSPRDLSWPGRQQDYAGVTVALHLRLRSGRGSAGIVDGQQELLDRVFALGVPTTVLVFGNPYVADDLPAAERVLIGYDQTVATVTGAARVLAGEADATGVLPVALRSDGGIGR